LLFFDFYNESLRFVVVVYLLMKRSDRILNCNQGFSLRKKHSLNKAPIDFQILSFQKKKLLRTSNKKGKQPKNQKTKFKIQPM